MSVKLAMVGVFANALAGKLYMSFFWRVKMLRGKEVAKKILASKEFAFAHSTQMNDAEYAPLLFGALAYLATQGVEAPVAGALAVAGSAVYLWGRILSGKFLPWSPLGAGCRYVSMGLLAYAMYRA